MVVRRIAIASLIIGCGFNLSACAMTSHTTPPSPVSAGCAAAWQSLADRAGESTGATSLSSIGTGTTDFYPTMTACGQSEWLSQFSETATGMALAGRGLSFQGFLDGLCNKAASTPACQR